MFEWMFPKAKQTAIAVEEIKKQNEALLNALTNKQSDLYEAIELALKRELKGQKQ